MIRWLRRFFEPYPTVGEYQRYLASLPQEDHYVDGLLSDEEYRIKKAEFDAESERIRNNPRMGIGGIG